MKKNIMKVILTVAISAAFAGTAFAGTWRTGTGSDSGKWWYDNGNKTWPASCWQWIDGNGDNLAECYYFDMNGWLATNTTTPDGYRVDGNGAWTVNGAVQRRNLLASGSGGESGAIDVSSAGYANGLSNVVNDMLNRNRAENAARYGESGVKNRETFVEVSYSSNSFAADYANNAGAASYSGTATGRPTRVAVGPNDAHLIFRDAPTEASVSTCREILRGKGYNVQTDGNYYIVTIGNCAVYVKPDNQSGYAVLR